MKVAMVTPMASRSAIADVMSQAVPELSKHWDLDVWCPSEPDLRSAPYPLNVFDGPDPKVVSRLKSYDLVVHVLGNSAFHRRIVPLVRACPGLVVLHDAALADLLLMTAGDDGRLDELVDYVRLVYGSGRAELLQRHGELGGSEEWLKLVAEVPLTELVAQNALGAVVHSRWHAAQVDGLTLGEVTVAPLPVPSMRLGLEDADPGRSAQLLADLPSDALLVVTVGEVNANRGLGTLLGAMAGAPELERLHLWAVGGGAAGAAARDMAESLGLGDRFALTGRVSDGSLVDILSRADMAAALRRPVLEGASASVVTQMLAGKPVIVYDHAHYRDLPDDAVLKVPVSDGPAGVRRALAHLAADPAERSARGERARAYVEATRTGTAYADALVQAAELAQSRRPQAHLVEDLSAHLHRLDLHAEPQVLGRVRDLAFELFDLS